MMYTMQQLDRQMRGIELEITRRFKCYGTAGFADADERRELSRRVEEASGGRNVLEWVKDTSATAIYMPSIYVRIPAQMSPISDARVGKLHKAFICGGSFVKDLCVGKYQGTLYTAPDSKKYLLSLRGMDPSVSQTLSVFSAAARDANTGAPTGTKHHICTNAEYSLLALICKAAGYQPRGNNYCGVDYSRQTEKGEPCMTYTSSNVEYVGRVLTGSGPMGWAHDGTPYGVWDLNGNVWEFTDGLQLSDGYPMIIADNNAASDDTSINATYKAILADGTLGATTDATALKYVTAAADYGIVVPGSGSQFTGVGKTYTISGTAYDAPAIMKELCLIPHDTGDYSGDCFWHNLSGARVALRGGPWDFGALCGVFALNLFDELTFCHYSVGARPAFLRI